MKKIIQAIIEVITPLVLAVIICKFIFQKIGLI